MPTIPVNKLTHFCEAILEGAGVPRDLLAKVDEVVAIPHAPQVESLNAGVAASIVLYEAARQQSSGS